MKDESTRRLARFAHDLRFEDLPPVVVAKASDHLLDALGCAIGGFDAPPARIARHLAPRLADNSGEDAIVVGEPGLRTSASEATFLNGVRLRYLDHNDVLPGCHPSDVLGALWACASGRSGRDLLCAAVVGYEVCTRIVRTADLRARGWDQSLGVGVGVAAALGSLLRLPQDRIEEAIAITAVSTLHLRATRAGQLSAWKGCATAWAARAAVDAVRLAAAGMDGPQAPFDGRHGLAELVTGPLRWPPLPDEGGEHWVLQTSLKHWPVEHGLQPAVWLAVEARGLVAPDALAEIALHAPTRVVAETAQPDRWEPATREAADHSLPYVFARALIEGGITPASFTPDALADPDVRALTRRVTVTVDPDLDERGLAMRAELTNADGEVLHLEVVEPPGQATNPLDRSQVEDKLRGHARRLLPEPRIDALLAGWSALTTVDDAGALLRELDLTGGAAP